MTERVVAQTYFGMSPNELTSYIEVLAFMQPRCRIARLVVAPVNYKCEVLIIRRIEGCGRARLKPWCHAMLSGWPWRLRFLQDSAYQLWTCEFMLDLRLFNLTQFENTELPRLT